MVIQTIDFTQAAACSPETMDEAKSLIKTRAPKRHRRTPFSRTLISLALISYIISDQLFMTALIGSIRLFNVGSCINADMSGLDKALEKGSLIHLAAANPAPAPMRAASARSATSQRVPPMNGSMFGKRDLASNVAHHQSVPTTSEATNYNDIITEVIENFMASNKEGDPEETTAAFCRMIVYECNKLISNRRRKTSIGRTGR